MRACSANFWQMPGRPRSLNFIELRKLISQTIVKGTKCNIWQRFDMHRITGTCTYLTASHLGKVLGIYICVYVFIYLQGLSLVKQQKLCAFIYICIYLISYIYLFRVVNRIQKFKAMSFFFSCFELWKVSKFS